MKRLPHTAHILTTAIAIALGACAGGGESGTGFVPENNVSVGVITGFGSVFVNGVKFDTGLSSFSIDDQQGDESQLKVGMVVTVYGEINTDGATGRAARILFDDDVEGPVTDVSAIAAKQLTVMGQTVQFDANTFFESHITGVTTIDGISVGNIVEVSGHSSGNGTIYATRIEAKEVALSGGREIEVKGLITGIDTGAQTFLLGGQTVAYASATIEPQGVTLANGMYVEAKSTSGLDTNQHLLATKIEIENENGKSFELESGKEMELEGLISDFDSTNQSFSVNGHAIHYDNTTQINNVTLANGVKVQVKVVANSGGGLVAEEIEGRLASNTKLNGLIEAIDTTKKTVTLLGDRVVAINSFTAVEDDRDGIDETTRKYFNFSNLQVGQYIEVVVYYDANSGQLIATKLELDDDPNSSSDSGDPGDSSGSDSSTGDDVRKVELEGTIEVIADDRSSIKVAGVTITVSDPALISNFNVGDYVDIEAQYASTTQTGGATITLVAIELED